MTEQLPVIDWKQHAQAGDVTNELGKELLALFLHQLPELEQRLQKAFAEQNKEELHAILHRLQGACAYCGLPRLRHAVADVDQKLKQSGAITSAYYQQIQQEIELAREELARHNIQAAA